MKYKVILERTVVSVTEVEVEALDEESACDLAPVQDLSKAQWDEQSEEFDTLGVNALNEIDQDDKDEEEEDDDSMYPAI